MSNRYDVDSFVAERERLKSNNPIWYFLTGGDKATEYHKKNVGMMGKTQDTAENVVEVVGDIAGSTFDVFVWIKDNWQLAILGFVALLVLLRD